MASASFDFRLLGPFEVVVDGRDVTPARPKQRVLLALLLLRANEVVASDELVEALWGEEPPETAQTALHGHVSALRKLLGQEAIETKPPGYVLRVWPERTDLGRFLALVEEARREDDSARRGGLLRAALELFRGEPLADFRYEAFARAESERIEELRLSAIELRVEAELELGRHAELVPELDRLVVEQPLRERLRAQLMLALYRSGRQSEALHVYQEGRQLLAEELGLDPGPALQALERQILTQDTALAPPSRAGAAQPPRARRERKVVTVLFCDLVGFTARSEELDPEDVQALLEPYFARVREQLEHFGGTVEKFIGDAVMAVFGAPLAHEDDPERAVRAALAIRDALQDELELRIAVHTGEALVTLDADPRAGEGIVAGDVVNTASRLQAFAPANGVIVGERTHRASQEAIEYAALDPVVARGKQEPVRVWEALAVRARVEPRRPRAALVGRARELDQLADLLGRARAERSPQLVTVVGVPGMGKTRLIRELYGRVEAGQEDAAWLQGRSLPYGDGVTFWALGEIVKAQAGIFEDDQPETAAEKLRLTVEESIGNGEGRWVLRHLHPLVGLPGEGELGGDRRDESFAAWRVFFEALAEETPLVLVFEDVHWADEALLDFVDDLIERAAEVGLLVVCTCRPELLERRPGWGGGKRNATTISLAPLSETETAELLRALTDRESSEELIARAEGNPLYAEEYARLTLEREPGAELPVPLSLQSLIAARLDLLTTEEKALVQDGAVIGETAWAGAVAAVGERPRPAVEELLRPLERKEFLHRRRRTSIEGETEYVFPHVLVRDVAYAQIPRAERSRKHLRAADWIESLGRREDHAELLAHHYLCALELERAAGGEVDELEEKAGQALADAGERAAVLSAHGAAVRHFELALDLVPADDPRRPPLLLGQAKARFWGEHDEVVAEWLERARDELLGAGDEEGAAEAAMYLGELAYDLGSPGLGLPHYRQAAALVERRPTSRVKAEVFIACAVRHVLTEQPGAARYAEAGLAMAEELGDPELRALAIDRLGIVRQAEGDLDKARECLEQSAAVAEGLWSPVLTRLVGNLASLLFDLGELDRARALHDRALELVGRLALPYEIRFFRFERSIDCYFAGAWDEALTLASDHLTASAGQPPTKIDVPCLIVRARIALARGNTQLAFADSERALAIIRPLMEPQLVNPALAWGARCFAGRRRAEAEELAREALARMAARAWVDTPQCLVDLASALRQLGLGEELAAATAAVSRTPWLDASLAIARGEYVQAAEILEGIGSCPDEAYARLRAAEQLVAEGRRGEADEQLERALAFWRSVGATAYVREGEALLAPPPGFRPNDAAL